MACCFGGSRRRGQYDYDLVVLGAGSAGLTAVSFACDMGLRTALVEAERVGGDCTWHGCVPSKALIHRANTVHAARVAARRYGLRLEEDQVDMDAIADELDAVRRQIYEEEAPEKLQADNPTLTVLHGHGRFVDANSLRVVAKRDEDHEGKDRGGSKKDNDNDEEQEGKDANEDGSVITGRHFLVCTGAAPKIPDLDGLKLVPYFTNLTIFDNRTLPSHLLVVGTGPVATELGQAYRRLGARVTMFGNGILAKESEAVRAVMLEQFEEDGIAIVPHRPVRITARDGDDAHAPDSIAVHYGTDQIVSGDALLVAIGRRPNTANMNLEDIGVQLAENHGIVVNNALQTAVPHIFACGDVLGREQFTHYAGWQAFQAVRNAVLPGSASGISHMIPRATFTTPEVGSVGMTPDEAIRVYGRHNIIVRRRDHRQHDRALCDDASRGFVQLVVLKNNSRLLGCDIVADRAGEMLSELALAINNNLTATDIAKSIHPYPAYNFVLQQMFGELATESFLGSTIGKMFSKKK